MKQILMAAFIISISCIKSIQAEDRLQTEGRINLWSLYETDDFDSTKAALVYDTITTPPSLLGIAVGRDVAIECSKANRSCDYRNLNDPDLSISRTTAAGDIISYNPATSSGDTLLLGTGLHSQLRLNPYRGKIDGTLTTSWLNDRTLYGSGKFRYRLQNLYVGYQKDRWDFTAGRQAIESDILIDGAMASYLFGPESAKENKTIAAFAGLSPDPIAKEFSKDFLTLGSKFHFIPEFANSSETKLLVDTSLVMQTYKNSVDRFSLFSRVHFTPRNEFSLLAYSTLELPWYGNDGEFKSSFASIQSLWRPNQFWFASLGFSQFRIDRHLQEESVRWITDPNSQQSLRVGESLDQSQRYRVEANVSYRMMPYLQPYVRGRYEYRTFDSSKNKDNSNPPLTNLELIDQKDAYKLTLGVRSLFLERWESETSYTYNRRFQSKGYDIFQSLDYEVSDQWTADLHLQYVSSSRTQSNSVTGVADQIVDTADYYAGIGSTYSFMTDFNDQIGYDFSSEEDPALAQRLFIHTVLARLDYHF